MHHRIFLQEIDEKILLTFSNEGTIRGDTFRFDSFISHSVEYIEVVKTLKGIFPNLILSNVMAVLLNFRPIILCIYRKNQPIEFRPEISPIHRPNGPYNILKVSAKNNVPFSRY